MAPCVFTARTSSPRLDHSSRRNRNSHLYWSVRRPARENALKNVRDAVRAADGRVADTLPIINGLAVRLPSTGRARLEHDPRVAAISVNARVRSQSDRFD